MAADKNGTWFGRLLGRKGEAENTRQYHAVVIRVGREPCEAVAAQSGERLLSAEAPLLPLKDCDRPERCSCRYQHYDDRRQGPRRGDETGVLSRKDPDQRERRYVRGRREDDAIEDEPPVSVHEDSYYQHAEDTARTSTLAAEETARTEALQVEETEGVDPYNSGSFDKAKVWGSTTKK